MEGDNLTEYDSLLNLWRRNNATESTAQTNLRVSNEWLWLSNTVLQEKFNLTFIIKTDLIIWQWKALTDPLKNYNR